jgi:hypothetical protein
MARITLSVQYSDQTPVNLSNDFMLLTDSQDVDSVRDHFGLAAYEKCIDLKFRSFFVIVGDGDYDQVFGCYVSVPHDYTPLYKIEQIFE